jgi:hypothetical protein
VDNLDGAYDELSRLLGKQWVSKDIAIRICYGRDQSPCRQQPPHIVVLPSSTEEVSGVLKIANRRKIPVVARSIGANTAGLSIPKRGGILLDLARMDKILHIDEENMYVTVQPYVNFGQVQIEGEKFGMSEGRALRAVQPSGPASVSVMGNHLMLGLSIASSRYGTGSNRIISMTVVLPDGEIVKLRRPGDIGGVSGPGMDIAMIYRCGNARYGICTEITVELMPIQKYKRFYMISHDGKNPYPMIDLIYQITRTDIEVECCMIEAAHAAQMMTLSTEDAAIIKPQVPQFWLFVSIDASTEKEIEAKEKILKELVEKSECELLNPSLQKMFFDCLGSASNFTRKVREVVRYMRTRDGYLSALNWIKLETIPKIDEANRNAINQHLGCRDPWVKDKEVYKDDERGLYIQPYEFGRNCLHEMDFFSQLSTPQGRLSSLMVMWENALQSQRLGVTAGAGRAKVGSTFQMLESKLKEVFDPNEIMNPPGYGEIEGELAPICE